MCTTDDDTDTTSDTGLVTELVRLLRRGAARSDCVGPFDELLDLIDEHAEQLVRLLATGAGMTYPLPERLPMKAAEQR